MSAEERTTQIIGFKVTPSVEAEIDKLQAEMKCRTRTDLMRIITSEYLASHKKGTTKHVNQSKEANIDEICARLREILVKELTEVTGSRDNNKIESV